VLTFDYIFLKHNTNLFWYLMKSKARIMRRVTANKRTMGTMKSGLDFTDTVYGSAVELNGELKTFS
jgi:hypothetical protein